MKKYSAYDKCLISYKHANEKSVKSIESPMNTSVVSAEGVTEIVGGFSSTTSSTHPVNNPVATIAMIVKNLIVFLIILILIVFNFYN